MTFIISIFLKGRDSEESVSLKIEKLLRLL